MFIFSRRVKFLWSEECGGWSEKCLEAGDFLVECGVRSVEGEMFRGVRVG